MFVNGEEKNVSIYQRSELKIGQQVSGPGIICEPTGTNIIDDGWIASIDKHKNLILSRISKEKKKKVLVHL